MGAASDVATSFGLTVLSETGDKSQLLLIALAARWKRTPVAVGGVIGIIAVQLLAVLAGGWLGSRADDGVATAIALAVGTAFVLLGLAALASARRSMNDDRDENDNDSPGRGQPTAVRSIVGATAGLLFAAELGDKTMFTTAALSAVRSPIAVFVGASAAFALLAVVAVVIGGAFADRVPTRTLTFLAGVAFLLAGVATIATA